MLLTLLSSVFGSVFSSIVSIFTKTEDVKLKEYQADADVDKTLSTAQPASHLDLISSLSHDLIVLGVAVNIAVCSWDNLVVHTYNNLYWEVVEYPQPLAWLPYLVSVYLFGGAGMVIYKRFFK